MYINSTDGYSDKFKMYALVFSCVLILGGVSGNYLFPAWRQSPPNASLDESQAVINETTSNAYYFQTFNLRKLNPVYWFYDSSEADKLDKLYELVKCVIEDETVACREKLQINRKLFEKKNLQNGQKEEHKNTITHHNTINSSTSDRNVEDHSTDILNKNQVEAVSHNQRTSPAKSPTVAEPGENSTIPGENEYTVET